jgi:hypothetical protein
MEEFRLQGLGTRCCREYSDLQERRKQEKRIEFHNEKLHYLSLFFTFFYVIKSRSVGALYTTDLTVK